MAKKTDDKFELAYDEQMPHHKKINGEWYYIHFGGELISKVSDKKAKELEKNYQILDKELKKLVKELEKNKW